MKTATLWVVAVVMQKHECTTVKTTQTLSWKSDCSEDEARGHAVAFAMNHHPGWTVAIVTPAKIEIEIT